MFLVVHFWGFGSLAYVGTSYGKPKSHWLFGATSTYQSMKDDLGLEILKVEIVHYSPKLFRTSKAKKIPFG